ncbi:MAG: helix-turn-helix transcriptional regulator [Oscillospiraceae bacterium]|nr:helix-turn-helix transcriptional regulator [Oscillospiraceae bacterium]
MYRGFPFTVGNLAAQVAEILNFSDTPYFYTVFKRETGMTPVKYRKQKIFDKHLQSYYNSC